MSIYGNKVSPRKAMGMGMGPSGAEDVGKLPGANGTKMGASGGELKDGERGVGMSIGRKGAHPMQAAPDHGSSSDHYSREGKA